MTELQEIQTLFSGAARAIDSRFAERGMLPGDVSPEQLTEALTQLLHVFDKLDRENGEYGPLPYDDPSELGEHGVNIAADLATWAERMELDQAKTDVEKVAVGVALWVGMKVKFARWTPSSMASRPRRTAHRRTRHYAHYIVRCML